LGGASSVAELDARTGALVRVISRKKYRLEGPAAIAVAGGHVWVANVGDTNTGGTVTELNARTGALVRAISRKKYRFGWPFGIAVAGGHVWVANGGAGY